MGDENDEAPSGGGVGGWLRGLVVRTEEVDDGTPEPDAAPVAPAAPTAPRTIVAGARGVRPTAPVPTAARFSAPASIEDIDPAIRAKIDGVVAQAAMPAYSVFEKMELGMRSVIPDERMRLAATLSAMAAQNVASSAIVTDLDECLVALDKREADADRSVQAAIANRVGQQEGRMTQCETEIAAKHAEITKLQSEIDDLENERDACRAAVSKARAEIEEMAQRFSDAIATYRAIYQQKKQQLLAIVQGGST